MTESEDDSDYILSEQDEYSSVSEDEASSGYASSASDVTNTYSEYSDDDYEYAEAVSCAPGALSRMSSVPLAIFLEVASHLHPLDILHISRTNRAWHDTLFSRSSKYIWTASLQQLRGLPRCPEELCGAAYVSLLFEKVCNHCASPAPRADFALRVRLCIPCARGTVIGPKLLNSLYPHVSSEVFKLLPHTNMSPFTLWQPKVRPWHPHHYSDTEDEDSETENVPIPSNEIFFYLPSFEAIVAQMIEKKNVNDERQYTEWMMEREARARRVVKHARNVGKWLKASTLGKAAGTKKKRARRVKGVVDRLLVLGHDERDVAEAIYNYQGFVCQPKNLTEQEWLKKRDDLEKYAILARERRIQKEEAQRIRSRKYELLGLYHEVSPLQPNVASACQLRPIYPTAEDFYHLPSVFALWQSRTEPLTQDDWPEVTAVVHEMQVLVSEIRKDLEKVLSIAASQTESITGDDVIQSAHAAYHTPPALDLAMSVVSCSTCYEPLHWPTVLEHTHVRGSSPGFYHRTELKWNVTSIVSSQFHLAIMRGILKAAGLDERTATVLQLDQLGPARHENRPGHFHCRCCPEPKPAMPWRRLFTHFLKTHADRAASLLETACMDTQQPDIASIIPPITPSIADSKSKVFLCRLCPTKMRTFDGGGIVSHLKAKHGKEKDEAEQYIIRTPA